MNVQARSLLVNGSLNAFQANAEAGPGPEELGAFPTVVLDRALEDIRRGQYLANRGVPVFGFSHMVDGRPLRVCCLVSGVGEIRTHGTVSRSAVFKTAAFNHSATTPGR
jgi:hypothetical protein